MSSAGDLVREFFALYRNHEVAKMTELCWPGGSFEYVPMGDQGVRPRWRPGETVGGQAAMTSR
jgi:hypothetical protein